MNLRYPTAIFIGASHHIARVVKYSRAVATGTKRGPLPTGPEAATERCAAHYAYFFCVLLGEALQCLFCLLVLKAVTLSFRLRLFISELERRRLRFRQEKTLLKCAEYRNLLKKRDEERWLHGPNENKISDRAESRARATKKGK